MIEFRGHIVRKATITGEAELVIRKIEPRPDSRDFPTYHVVLREDQRYTFAGPFPSLVDAERSDLWQAHEGD